MEFVNGGRAVNGYVKRAYPLQSVGSVSAVECSTSTIHGDLGTFGPGVGPCGPDASQIVAIIVENRKTFDSCLVYFYDKWASTMQFLQRHYKIQISGQGLATLDWAAGAETEERVQCVIVAEKNVLERTLTRQARLFTLPHCFDIKVTYAEPQRLLESDQLRYLASEIITSNGLNSGISRQSLVQTETPPKKRSYHGKRRLEQVDEVSPAYRYSRLSELVDGFADLYGVVVNMTLPKKTSGRDFCMTVSVTDESRSTRAAAIQINIFYPTIAKMPKIKYVGDIIRFHKVKIQQYQDKIQGLSLHRATRHLILRQKSNGKLEQLTNSETWTFEPSDEQRTLELIKWARTSLAFDDTLPLGCPQAPKLLFDLKAAEDFIDLVVRVLHVVDSDEAVRLIIWDGSGNAAESDHALVSALQNKGVDIPPHGLLKEVIMSSCWSVVQEMGFVDEMLASWCRFRNLAVGRNELLPDTALASGIREILRFREVTSFVLMPEFSLDIQRRCSLNKCSNPNPTINFQRRRSNENVAEPNQVVEIRTIIPDHIFKSVPVTPLREILNSLQIPRKYHCRAFFRSVWPDIEKICKPKSDKSDEYIYSFALSVQEGNESMNIIVYGNDAAHFLHGIPPCDLSKSTSSKTLLQKRFAALFQASKASHLCIKSYYVSLPPGHSSGSINAVRYRLFHTLLQYEEHE